MVMTENSVELDMNYQNSSPNNTKCS